MNITNISNLPLLGVGMGYRDELCDNIFENTQYIDFLEITMDHFVTKNKNRKNFLVKLKSRFEIVAHGLNLSLGSASGINKKYLNEIKPILKNTKPPWWSEHISFTTNGDIEIGHLSPLPFNKESLKVLSENIKELKEEIKIPLILENITYTINLPWNKIEESKYLSEVVYSTGCGLLLDITNLFINSKNHSFDPIKFIDNLPENSIVQMHFVGAMEKDGTWVDTHSCKTQKEIFDLIDYVLSKFKVKGIILERDSGFSDFKNLIDELSTVKEIWKKYNQWI